MALFGNCNTANSFRLSRDSKIRTGARLKRYTNRFRKNKMVHWRVSLVCNIIYFGLLPMTKSNGGFDEWWNETVTVGDFNFVVDWPSLLHFAHTIHWLKHTNVIHLLSIFTFHIVPSYSNSIPSRTRSKLLAVKLTQASSEDCWAENIFKQRFHSSPTRLVSKIGPMSETRTLKVPGT